MDKLLGFANSQHGRTQLVPKIMSKRCECPKTAPTKFLGKDNQPFPLQSRQGC